MHMLILLIIIVICSALFLQMHYKCVYKYWKVRNVPYLKAVPVFGSAFSIFAGKISIGNFLHKLYEAGNAPFEGFFILHKPWLLIRNIDLIKTILVKDFEIFADRATAHNLPDDELMTTSLFFLRNIQWKYARHKLTPTTSSHRLKNSYSCIQNIGNELVSYIAVKSVDFATIDIKCVTVKYVTEVMSSFVFGIESHAFKDENSEVLQAANKILDKSFFRNLQTTCYMIAPLFVKPFSMKFIEPTTTKYLRSMYWSVMKEVEHNPASGGSVAQYLTQLKKEKDLLFDGNALVAQSMQYFYAGLETISVTISYSLYELGLNTVIQDRLRREIVNYSDGKNISYDDLNQMRYLDMVVNETLRKYPAFPYLDRQCTKNYQLPGTDITILKGTSVCISLLGLHYDPSYFTNPQRFDPERFSKQNIGLIDTGCYMPFGLGPRFCIGERLAMLIIKSALIQVLYKFTVQSAENSPLQFAAKSLAMATLEGIQLKFTEVRK